MTYKHFFAIIAAFVPCMAGCGGGGGHVAIAPAADNYSITKIDDQILEVTRAINEQGEFIVCSNQGQRLLDLNKNVINLTLPSGSSRPVSSCLNDLGQIAGWINGNNEGSAVVWDTPSTPRLLERPAYASAYYATAINNAGVVVGYFYNTETFDFENQKPLRWQADGKLEHLATFGKFCAPTHINNIGQIVGYSQDGDGGMTPIQWYSDGSVHEIAGLSSKFRWYPTALNNEGQILLEGCDAQFIPQVTILLNTDGSKVTLESLSGYDKVGAKGINDLGQIVGEVRTGDRISSLFGSKCLPVTWDSTGKCKVLKTLVGMPDGIASDITNGGMILGNCISADHTKSAVVIWEPSN